MPYKDKEKEKTLKAQIPFMPMTPLDGTISHYKSFASELIRPRPVDVWLPEGYDPQSRVRYPVIYMHDGQMLFHVETSPFAGMDLFWDVDKAMSRLARAGEINPAIVVAVWMADWNEGARRAEYMPQKPVTETVWQTMLQNGWNDKEGNDSLTSDLYLRFLVEELKPFIDCNYATNPDPSHTLMMGASMGGLISAYALSEYPEVYGGVACLSTDWTISDGAVVRWLQHHWPAAGSHQIYFDHGTETYDAHYGPYQEQMDEVMRKRDYTAGVDWTSRRFVGADHSPKAWRERLHIPLKFLLDASK
jgi:enterochelin esterase-like enzyme